MNPFWPAGDPIQVDSQNGQPAEFHWQNRPHRIRQISDHWRVHTSWWPEGPPYTDIGTEVWRDYWEVATDTGLLCVIYQDLRQGSWFLERVYA